MDAVRNLATAAIFAMTAVSVAGAQVMGGMRSVQIHSQMESMVKHFDGMMKVLESAQESEKGK